VGIARSFSASRGIIKIMSDDTGRQSGATDPDQPRLTPTTLDGDYSLSIEEVGDLYAQAGLARDLRTIQRYCRKGRLEARLVEFPYGEKYLITPTSVERHIAFLKELRLAAADRGEPGPAPASNPEEIPQSSEDRPATTSTDQPRPVAAADESVSSLVETLKEQNAFFRGEIAVKNELIKDLTERARETNVLIAGLQKMLTPLLGRGEARPERMHTYTPAEEAGDNDAAA
jgi:hypothetical protein